MVNSRQLVFDALLKTEKNGSYSNITLDALLTGRSLDTRDKAFVSALFYGIIERKLTVDYQLCKYLTKPLKKLKPEILIILEMGAYQILFMDKVPDSAAVNESVKLAKKNGCSFASGLINAVLRKVADNGISLPDISDFTEYLSVKYSCPEEYINIWLSELGEEDTVSFLESTLGSPEISIRVNSLRTDVEELSKRLRSEGVTSDKNGVENSLNINLNTSSIDKLDSYKNGLYHVQDISCQICSSLLGVKSGDRVFDMCSAPGGKAFTVAEMMNNSGEVVCFDIHEHRVKLIEKGAERLGLTCISAKVGNAMDFNESLGLADAVLCDVPCSGLGIIRRKPEIKYKSMQSIEELPEIQYKILDNSSHYVKKGGTLLYSTCTLLNRENRDVCLKFLNEHSDFYALKLNSVYSDDEFITLLPHKFGGDGFFICVFKRKGD